MDQVGEVVMQSAAAATGNGTAYDGGTGGYNRLEMQVEGISGDTITFEATIDGSNWVAALATNRTSGTAATTATADGIYGLDVAGLFQVRARISTYSAGTINVTGRMQA